MTARTISRIKTRKPTRTFIRTLLPCVAGGANGAFVTDIAAGRGGTEGEAGGTGIAPGASGRRAPHLEQNLPAPTGEPHCAQNGMNLAPILSCIRGDQSR